MVNKLRTRLSTRPAPNPSVETLLHAFLPPASSTHTQADANLALKQPDGAGYGALGDAFGGGAVRHARVPAEKLAAEMFEGKARPEAVLLKHGCSRSQSAARANQRTIDAVGKGRAVPDGAFETTRRNGRAATSVSGKSEMARSGPIPPRRLAAPSGKSRSARHAGPILEQRTPSSWR